MDPRHLFVYLLSNICPFSIKSIDQSDEWFNPGATKLNGFINIF